MNLSLLERMSADGDMSLDALRYLIECRGECEWLDYKEELRLDRDDQVAKFAKDVLAFKNVGGGYLVIGVRDKSWSPIGLAEPLPFDTKLLRDQVRRATGIDIDVDIVQHELHYQGRNAWFPLILVRASRKRSKRRSPSLVKKDFHAREPYGLRRGQIYVRQGDQTALVERQEQLEDLLGSLEDRADQDRLQASTRLSSFAIDTGTYRLLEKEYGSFVGRVPVREELLSAITRDPRLWIVNVHGPGGVGKSALATWAAYQMYESGEFESIIQLTAKETVLAQSGITRAEGRTLYSLEDLLDRVAGVFEEPTPDDLQGKKDVVVEILSAWSTLLILDNMETVHDGRILAFVQALPHGIKAKVLLTSRQTTGGWEFPVPVKELVGEEVKEFVDIKAAELGFPASTVEGKLDEIEQVSGGLPLAIQWVLGKYKSTGDLSSALSNIGMRDSPILEFSFRNVWDKISPEARSVLAALSIFDDPPALVELATVMDWSHERIERALGELRDVTLVSRYTHPSGGRVTFSALPITMTFAQHQLHEMGDFEVQCRRRLQRFTQQMELRDWEVERFTSVFDRYDIRTDSEKRAAILCRRGESETFSGREDQAGSLFKQARELSPRSAYVYAMSANYELSQSRVGVALRFANEACARATQATGALAFSTKARVLDRQHDKPGRVAALERAVQYDPEDMVLRHQYGVALSRAGATRDAIRQFDIIVEKERSRPRPTDTLVMALKTRVINYRRLGDEGAAQEDLRLAMALIKEHSHLQSQAEHISELLEG